MNENYGLKIVIALLSVALFFSLAVIFVLATKPGGQSASQASNKMVLDEQKAKIELEKKAKYSPALLSEAEIAQIKVDAQKFCAQANLSSQDKSICIGGEYAYFSDRAVKERSLGICMLIELADPRNICLNNVYMQLAMTKMDTEYCAKLIDDSQKKACSNEVNYNLAKKKPSEGKKYCEMIDSATFRSNCLLEIGIK